VAWKDAVFHYYLGGLVGLAVQWQLGGDLARAAALGQSAGRRQVVLASVVLERVAGLAAAGVMAAAAWTLLNLRYPVLHPTWLALAAAPLAAIVTVLPLAVCVVAGAPALDALVRRAPRLAARAGLPVLRDALAEGRRFRLVVVGFFALTLVEQAIALVALWVLKEALGLPIGAYEIVAVSPVIMFFARLPISVEALGIYESLSLVLFGLTGLRPAQSVAMALTDRVMGLLVVTLGTLLLLGLRRGAGAGAIGLRPER
jgi:hypothetical protein